MISKKQIKVCVNGNCCQRGAYEIHDQLERRFGAREETDVIASPDCFRFCKSGANVSVNGNILHGLSPINAVQRVERELHQSSRKIDGLGMRSLDELDDVLENLL